MADVILHPFFPFPSPLSHLDQSLFTRFIRLGTPYVELNAQGRARPAMAKLYNWRYRALGDLPYVSTAPEYRLANAGLAFDYQFINVEDFMGRVRGGSVERLLRRFTVCFSLISSFHGVRLSFILPIPPIPPILPV